jgi:hypothetical protein
LTLNQHNEGLFKLPDDQIPDKPKHEQKVIVTFDPDFGELLVAADIATRALFYFGCGINHPRQ